LTSTSRLRLADITAVGLVGKATGRRLGKQKIRVTISISSGGWGLYYKTYYGRNLRIFVIS
jgi:hypothetical protein